MAKVDLVQERFQERPKAADVFLPLYVPLEQFLLGAIRHVQVNKAALSKAGYTLTQDTFEVLIPKGAPDGHRVTFRGKAMTGDVIFVLQELAHETWKRRGVHLFLEKRISVVQALTGSPIIIDHLDGERLMVKSAVPGEIWQPRQVEEAQWLRFDDVDVFPRQDAAVLKTGDLEACKDICRRNGWSGFTYFENCAYFRAQDRDALLQHKTPSPKTLLFVVPKAATSSLQSAILNKGMPDMGRPSVRGHLFVSLRIEAPNLTEETAKEVLRQVLAVDTCEDLDEDLEEFELCDMDVQESLRQQMMITGPEIPAEEEEVSPCPPM